MTIIKLVAAMDAGPIVDQVRIAIRPDDTAGALTARLGNVGAERLVAVLGNWVAGRLEAQAQDESAATYTRLLTRQDGRLDWTKPADNLARRVRAFDPWPGSFAFLARSASDRARCRAAGDAAVATDRRGDRDGHGAWPPDVLGGPATARWRWGGCNSKVAKSWTPPPSCAASQRSWARN